MSCSYAAIGETDRVYVVIENVEPLTTATPAVIAHDSMKFPAVEASHSDTWDRVSDVVIDQVPNVFRVIDPADAAFQVIALRVVTALAFAVPAEPGSPVCSLMNGVAIPV
jgi:hypothetical protein